MQNRHVISLGLMRAKLVGQAHIEVCTSRNPFVFLVLFLLPLFLRSIYGIISYFFEKLKFESKRKRKKDESERTVEFSGNEFIQHFT